jgi:galactokinase
MTGEGDLRSNLTRAFEASFGGPPEWVARAPGRVNLIGEHTDYNDGFVLPMAIDRAVWVVGRSRRDRTVAVYSLYFDARREFELDGLARGAGGEWIEYVRGVAWALQERGHALRGWEGVTAGDVPVGAGLSSSAAVEMATARAFHASSGFAWEPREMALLGQRAENEWVGVNSGIMDQMISASGVEGHALLIDCRSLEARPVPLPPGTSVVILDTSTRRGLVGSAYNERRAACEAAAAFFGVPALRDVDVATLEARAPAMDPVSLRRARHVVTENARTLEAAEAMARGDAATMGRLMNASHASLRDDFEVSRRELDVIVELAQGRDGCHGARMTGAGFGGCAVALVETGAVDGFVREVAAGYQAATRLHPKVYVCAASAGASLERLADAPGTGGAQP